MITPEAELRTWSRGSSVWAQPGAVPRRSLTGASNAA